MFTVAALYRFVDLPDFKDHRDRLEALCRPLGIKGTLLLAPEGINGTVAGTREAIDALKKYLMDTGLYDGMEYKESAAEHMPFLRLKVRLKKEIVTIGDTAVNPNRAVGIYVDPQEWNALISDPETLVLDTRNDYEVLVGTFERAVNPETQTFTQFPAFVRKTLNPQKHKRVAMFCTGGIRCEKASSFMKLEGYEEVYHLKGGILKYLETVAPEESLWKGDCFVFDGRVAVGHGLQESDVVLCYTCRMPLSDADQASASYEPGVQCPHCADSLSEDRRRRAQERHRQVKLAEERGTRHLGS